MSEFFTSTWMTVILTILILMLNWVANKLEEKGPMWVMISIRTVQIAIIGYYIYHIYRIFAG